jgi:hypothetical protein
MNGEVVAKIVRALEKYYRASAEDVRPFLEVHENPECREVLMVRQGGEEIEISLVLPKHLMHVRWDHWETLSLDERCQVVEGASHFLMVCDRARTDRPTTQLELELQAEVDKWLILSRGGRLDVEADAQLRDTLYEGAFLHPANSDEGHRYRLANNLAARFVHKLSRAYVWTGKQSEMREELLKFFRMSQHDKLRAVAA